MEILVSLFGEDRGSEPLSLARAVCEQEDDAIRTCNSIT